MPDQSIWLECYKQVSGNVNFQNRGKEYFYDQQLQYSRKWEAPNNNELARLGGTQIHNNEEQEKCKRNTGLFEVLSDKFKPQHN